MIVGGFDCLERGWETQKACKDDVREAGKRREGDSRIVEFGHLRKTVYHIIGTWP